MKELLKSLLGLSVPSESPVSEGDPPADTTPKNPPSIGEINQWNKYLAFFNDKVKKDKVTDETLDAGDGSYARNSYAEWAVSNKVSTPYEDMTKKMQEYYINLYNSKDSFASSLVKGNYPKPQLSAIDGRVGSLTRNYYVPTMNYAKTVRDKNGDKTFSYKGVFNPYSDSGIDVVHNSMLDDNMQPMSNENVANFYREYAQQKSKK